MDDVHDRGLRYKNFDLIHYLNNRAAYNSEISEIVTGDKIAQEEVIRKRIELGLDNPNTLIQPNKCTISYLSGNVARKVHLLKSMNTTKIVKTEPIKKETVKEMAKDYVKKNIKGI